MGQSFPGLESRPIAPPTLGTTVSKLASVRLDDDDDDDDDDGVSTKIDHNVKDAAARAPPSYNDATQKTESSKANYVARELQISLGAAKEILRRCDNVVQRALSFQHSHTMDFIRIVDEYL